MSATEARPERTRRPSPRRLARELAAQVLYGWLLNPRAAADIKRDARLEEDFRQVDAGLFDQLVDGVTAGAEGLRASLAPLLDRRLEQLSPVEHAILLMGALELSAHVETPYRVVINEAVEVARTFGGTDGHRFVNGVLDRLAAVTRPAEVQGRSGRAP